ncbi:TrbC/VirB2 family protein [Dialister micraerophilus]|uniref:TrbC/VirB2 family protein n=1 Tax=Dialister micraerophilus TaxID=309120 RepID=UPI0023F3FD10|nr:TrbC/VirB2 family protein [Dialister micraerophilus]
MKFLTKAKKYINVKILSFIAFLLSTPLGTFAFYAIEQGSGVQSKKAWPWTKFLNSIMAEFTGPVPLVLGVLGVVGAAIALFSGHGGDGAKKFIILIFAVSIALFAPTLIQWVAQDAGGGFLII